MSNFTKKSLIFFGKHFLFAFVMLCLFYILFGSYYEEYQGYFHAFFSGALSPGTPFDNFYFLGYIGISHIYSFLYQTFPGIQWMSYIHYLQLAISFALIASITRVLLDRLKVNTLITWLIQVLLFYTLYADNILHFVYARTSYIMCAASLLAIIGIFNNTSKIKQHPYLYVILNLFFLYGTLTRVESALSLYTLYFCFAVVWYLDIKKAILITLPAMVIVIIATAGVFLDIKFSDQFHKQVEPDIETQFTIRFNAIPVEEMKTYKDSIKYEAATQMFWGDPDIITPEYLRSLIKKNEPTFNKQQWDRTYYELIYFYEKFEYIFLTAILLSLVSLVFILYNKNYTQASLLVLYFIGFIILMASNSYFVKMRDRTVSPFLFAYSASIFILFLSTLKNINTRYIRNASIIILLGLGTAAQAYYLKINVDKLNKAKKINEQIFNKVKEKCKGETLMVNPPSIGNITLAFSPFEIFNFSTFRKFYFYEASVQSIIPPYYNYLNKECNCDVRDFSNFYKYVLSDDYPGKVYILSTSDRIGFAKAYLKAIHDLEINYVKVDNIDLTENLAMDYSFKRKLYLYELKK